MDVGLRLEPQRFLLAMSAFSHESNRYIAISSSNVLMPIKGISVRAA
jgi:hypothetical protein